MAGGTSLGRDAVVDGETGREGVADQKVRREMSNWIARVMDS